MRQAVLQMAAALRPASRRGALFLALLAAADVNTALSWLPAAADVAGLARSAHDALVGVVLALREPRDAVLVEFYMGRAADPRPAADPAADQWMRGGPIGAIASSA